MPSQVDAYATSTVYGPGSSGSRKAWRMPYAGSIAHQTRELPDLRVAIKAGFGFGDVNACLVFRRWHSRA